jgi:hypothetical protein
MARFNIKRVELSGKPMGTSPLNLIQKGGNWTAEGDPQEIDSQKIQTLLDRLSSSKIKEFLPLAKAPSGEPSGLIVKTIDDQQSRTWVFWKGTTPTDHPPIYVLEKTAKSPEVYQMDDSLGEALPWAREFLKKPTPQPSSSAPAENPKK